MATTSNSTAVSTTQSSSSFISSSSSAEQSFSSSVASSISSSVSSAAASTTTVEPSSTSIVATSVVSASSAAATTQLVTTFVTQSHITSAGQSTLAPVTVAVTISNHPTTVVASAASSTSASASASSSAATLQNNGSSNSSSKGLSSAGKTAVAVVVPVVVVALLVLAGLFLWRRRKQKKNAEEARRKEVEDYGFNPNNDPTLPAVAADGHSEMVEDQSGYRGWGNTMSSNRKPSTTLSGGHTQGQLSDSGSNGAYASSPTGAAHSDGYSGDNLVHNRDTMSSDDLGALGAAPAAGANRNNDMRRGPSNASSSYSAGNRSDHSADAGIGQAYSGESYPNLASQYSLGQHGPYGDGSYGGGDGMPVVRDVSARRNTRIEQAGGYQQGNSGIAQNF